MTYTVKSWNNTNPERFDDHAAAVDRAERRMRDERAAIKLRDDMLGEVRTLGTDGLWSKWNDDSRYSAKDAMQDAADAIEDERE